MLLEYQLRLKSQKLELERSGKSSERSFGSVAPPGRRHGSCVHNSQGTDRVQAAQEPLCLSQNPVGSSLPGSGSLQ